MVNNDECTSLAPPSPQCPQLLQWGTEPPASDQQWVYNAENKQLVQRQCKVTATGAVVGTGGPLNLLNIWQLHCMVLGKSIRRWPFVGFASVLVFRSLSRVHSGGVW